MKNLSHAVPRFLTSEDGPTAVEYAVMMALILVVCVVAITSVGSNTNKSFSNSSLKAASVPAAS
jgi:pilus assembly protein Flp/PilA